MEFQIPEPPRGETKAGSKNRGVKEIENQIAEFDRVKQIQGKTVLVRGIESFEKSRVRDIGIPLCLFQLLVHNQLRVLTVRGRSR